MNIDIWGGAKPNILLHIYRFCGILGEAKSNI